MYLKRFFKDLGKYRKYLVYSAEASLKSEVAGSYLAWFWWILEPFCFMLIYKFIAEDVFHKKLDYAALFVFLGLTVWNFFNKCISTSSTLLKKNKGIVTKIYLPKYLIYIRVMLVDAFKMAISLAICFGLVVYYRVPIDWHALLIIPSLIMLFLVTFGFGCIIMHCGVYVQDLSKITRIGLRLVFYLSGVFYNIASIKPFGNIMLNINPVALAMEGCRNALMYNAQPDWLMLGIWTVVGAVFTVFGVVVVYKNENNYGKIL
jgi:ABC-type polysaccharide/polyol phosphate export permease